MAAAVEAAGAMGIQDGTVTESRWIKILAYRDFFILS
jgi:hypothetical protein